MIKQPAQYNTTNPPGQLSADADWTLSTPSGAKIVNPINLEQPLTTAVEAFQATTEDGLRLRVRNLEQELNRMRGQNLKLYLELEDYKAKMKNSTKFT